MRAEIGKILRELCGWKGVTIIEAEVCPDHIHMLADIQPKEASADRLVVTAKYAKYTGELNVDNDPNFVYEYAFVELTLVKEDGIWLVEDYIYPDITRYEWLNNL